MKSKLDRAASAGLGAKLTVICIACGGLATNSGAATVVLGTAHSFGVLAGSEITNTGPTFINGNVGISPGTSITDLDAADVNGSIHETDGVALQAKTDALAAFNDLADRPVTHNLTDSDLGGLTLTPGVYFFSSTAQLTGILTLDGEGVENPVFIFQIGSSLTTASDSSIVGINGVTSCDIFFQVGSSATLGTGTEFMGTIIADDSITLNTGTNVEGRILALNAAVTLDSNNINVPNCIPEPGSAALCLTAAALLCLRRKRL